MPHHSARRPTLRTLCVSASSQNQVLSPYLRCKLLTEGPSAPCSQESARLTDLGYVRGGTNLPLLVELLQSNGLAAQQFIVYGCSMIVLSALFSLYYSVKTAVVGFVLLGYGIYEVSRGSNSSFMFIQVEWCRGGVVVQETEVVGQESGVGLVSERASCLLCVSTE